MNDSISGSPETAAPPSPADDEQGRWGYTDYRTRCCASDETLLAHVKENLRFKIPMLPAIDWTGRTMIFVGGGPSLDAAMPEIERRYKTEPVDIFTSNFTHDYLIERGIVPKAMVLLDPLDYVLKAIENPHQDVTYLVSSQVMPEVFRRLMAARCKVVMYHTPANDEIHDLIAVVSAKLGQPYLPVFGGITTAVRCIHLGGIAGYRRIEYYGLDSSYTADGQYYAYDGVHAEKGVPKDEATERVLADDGREFLTSAGMAAQAKQFLELRDFYADEIELVVHGDGLLPHLYRIIPIRRSTA